VQDGNQEASAEGVSRIQEGTTMSALSITIPAGSEDALEVEDRLRESIEILKQIDLRKVKDLNQRDRIKSAREALTAAHRAQKDLR
jgi:cellobiose-specific phosphotransferase system component IIA